MYRIIICLLGFTVIIQSVDAQRIDEKELKTNIRTIHNPTEVVKSLEPVVFDFAVEKVVDLRLPKGSQFGFLTAATKDKAPELIKETTRTYEVGKNTRKAARFDEVDRDSLIPLLVAAVKEQQQQIELLKKELEELKKN